MAPTPRAESCFYFGPGIDHPGDSLRVLTQANKLVETRDVTWGGNGCCGSAATPAAGDPEQGGTQGTEDAPELGLTGDSAFDPTTPQPRLGRGIPHQLRVVSPMAQACDDFRAEDVESDDRSMASSESSDSDFPLGLGVTGQP